MPVDQDDAFATPDALAVKTQGVIPADHPDAPRELAAATAKIRDSAGWHIAKQREETVRCTARNGLLLLPTLHLVSVLSITDRGTVVDVDNLDIDDEIGAVYGRRWSSTPRSIVVTMLHGHADVPAPLAGLCMQVAARALGSPLGVVREQTLVSNVTFSTTAPGVAGGSVILDHEQADIDPYRLVRL